MSIISFSKHKTASLYESLIFYAECLHEVLTFFTFKYLKVIKQVRQPDGLSSGWVQTYRHADRPEIELQETAIALRSRRSRRRREVVTRGEDLSQWTVHPTALQRKLIYLIKGTVPISLALCSGLELYSTAKLCFIS